MRQEVTKSPTKWHELCLGEVRFHHAIAERFVRSQIVSRPLARNLQSRGLRKEGCAGK
jgi:hypothetical protein